MSSLYGMPQGSDSAIGMEVSSNLKPDATRMWHNVEKASVFRKYSVVRSAEAFPEAVSMDATLTRCCQKSGRVHRGIKQDARWKQNSARLPGDVPGSEAGLYVPRQEEAK